jgi:glycosyltransferase involved in cell wall biosynthesis
MNDFNYTFTVLTPTYNRARTLPRVYQSLQRQTFRDFEWLIVDDGSSDCTADLVRTWQVEADFPIGYIWQPNGGKCRAINRGVRAARGRFLLNLDSDDSCFPFALERFLQHWDSIPEQERDGFVGVTCLVTDEHGKSFGKTFPRDKLDSDPIEMRGVFQMRGEKWGFQRTNVLRKYPFPEIEGERFITEGVVWNRIALTYKTRYVNDVLGMYHYESDSLRSTNARARNPKGALLYYCEFVNCGRSVRVRARLRAYANYVRYSLHARQPLSTQARKIQSRVCWTLALPVGLLLYVRDRTTEGGWSQWLKGIR